MAAKEERIARTQGKKGIHAKRLEVESDSEMESEEEEEPVVETVKAVAKVKRKAIKKK